MVFNWQYRTHHSNSGCCFTFSRKLPTCLVATLAEACSDTSLNTTRQSRQGPFEGAFDNARQRPSRWSASMRGTELCFRKTTLVAACGVL